MGLKGDKSVGFEQHQNCPSLSKVVLREVRCVWFFGWLCMFVLVELRTETAERESLTIPGALRVLRFRKLI